MITTLYESTEPVRSSVPQETHSPILLRYVPMVSLTASQSRYLAEGVGTFFLVTTYSLGMMNAGLFSIDGKERKHNLAPMATGFVATVLVLCFGYISDAHFNPGVTLAATVAKGIRMEQAITYWLAQIVGGICGGFFAIFLNGTRRHLPAPQIYRNEPVYLLAAFGVETIFSVLLCSLVLHTVYSTQRNMDLYALTYGFGIMAFQYAAGTISGGAFNPSIALGLQLSKFVVAGYVGPLMQLWLYWAAPAVGAVVAAFLAQMTKPHVPKKEGHLKDSSSLRN